MACGKKPTVTFSEALKELLPPITDPYFNEQYIKIIAQIERDYEGEYIEKWDNGQMRLRVTFKNGKPDGHFHGWFPNGDDAFKGHFSEGTKQGIHIAFIPMEATKLTSCIIGRLVSYNRKGQLQGKQKSNGLRNDLKVMMFYCKGSLDGQLAFFDSDRKTIFEKYYNMGKEIPKPRNAR